MGLAIKKGQARRLKSQCIGLSAAALVIGLSGCASGILEPGTLPDAIQSLHAASGLVRLPAPTGGAFFWAAPGLVCSNAPEKGDVLIDYSRLSREDRLAFHAAASEHNKALYARGETIRCVPLPAGYD